MIEQWYPVVERIGGESRLVILNDGSRDGTYETVSYTHLPFDIQLFLKINELKNRGLQLKAIRTLIPQEARNTYPVSYTHLDVYKRQP